MQKCIETDYEFHEEWLVLEKYQFKIMTVITVLADNNRAFRGKLSELCNELSIQSSSGNIQRIKETLDYLCKQGYLTIIQDAGIYVVSLAKEAEKSKKITKIKKSWYKLIREAKKNGLSDAAWETMLKVFVVLLGYTEANSEDLHTYKEIADKIRVSEATVKRCVDGICSIDFVDFQIMRKVKNVRVKDEEIRGAGQLYIQGINFI